MCYWESARPRLVTTCWRGWEWFREGSWLTEILFIYSESPLVPCLQLLLSWLCCGFYESSVGVRVCVGNKGGWMGGVWLIVGTAERERKKLKIGKCRRLYTMEGSGRENRGLACSLEMVLKVLNADILWLWAAQRALQGQGLGPGESVNVWVACVQSLRHSIRSFCRYFGKLSSLPTPTSLLCPPAPQTPGFRLLLQLWLLPNLSRRLNMRLFRAPTCVGKDTEVLLPRRGQGSSIKQTACLDPLHQRFHTTGTGNTPVPCLNNQGALEAYECETW